MNEVGPLQPSAPHELHRLADDGVRGDVEPGELVPRDPQGGQNRRVELAHRPLTELLDPEVDRPRALHRSVRDPLREPAVALVEAGRRRDERPVRIRLLLEDAPHHLERGDPGGGDHLRPRRNSS